MRSFVTAAAGFLTLFDFSLWLMVIFFFWPHMLPHIADGTYDYMTQVKFILVGCIFVGILGALFSMMLDEFDSMGYGEKHA